MCRPNWLQMNSSSQMTKRLITFFVEYTSAEIHVYHIGCGRLAGRLTERLHDSDRDQITNPQSIDALIVFVGICRPIVRFVTTVALPSHTATRTPPGICL